MSGQAPVVPLTALITLFPSILAFTPLRVNRFADKLALVVLSKMARNLPFCSFASFLIVSLITFIYKADSSRDLIIFMILSILNPFF